MECNKMKMREALEFAVHQLVEATESDKYGDDVVYLVGCMRTVAEACRAALSAPARNCDMFSERKPAFEHFRDNELWKYNRGLSAEYWFSEWIFAPAEKGEGDRYDKMKMRKSPEAPMIKPCICRGLPVCETRRTECANALIMPLVEHRVRCDVCGRATHWYEDGGKAKAEWNAVAGIRDECNRLE